MGRLGVHPEGLSGISALRTSLRSRRGNCQEPLTKKASSTTDSDTVTLPDLILAVHLQIDDSLRLLPLRASWRCEPSLCR